ncbi:unnamed protein product [Meloidogyne enterolobii]|uniref:Uncharacterized protein n=1 Tax=Meloidogyne enterolobii TaxID=390850 RepID=A0ACB0XRI2_MELEN
MESNNLFVTKNFHDDITKWFGGDSSHSVLIYKTGGFFKCFYA